MVNVPNPSGHGMPVEKVLTAADPARPRVSVLYLDERPAVTP
jgi:hypothetical protein